MASLLLVDALGLKAAWRNRGARYVGKLLAHFRGKVQSALDTVAPATLLEGGVQSDAVALVFEDAREAVAVGATLYRDVFERPVSSGEVRLWLRGVIVSSSRTREQHPLANPLVRERPMPRWSTVRLLTQSGELLDAIALEQSGFRGMRLLIERTLVTPALESAFAIDLPNGRLNRFRHLTHSQYPKMQDFEDVLWVFPDEAGKWPVALEQMTRRLRYGGHDADEFVQAASTSLIFTEVDAIFRDLTSGRPIRAPRTRGKARGRRPRGAR